MPALNKPGVDWPEIRRRFIAGDSAYGLAKEFSVSKQAILKRANKEGWNIPGNPKKWLPAAKAATTATRLANPEDHSAVMLAHFGKRTPENAAQILALIETGIPKGRAANRCGMSRDTLERWAKDDADFAAQIEAAEASFMALHLANLNQASERGDVKAATWMLERHPSTRADFGGERQGSSGPQILVQVNVTRGAREALDTVDTKIIDADAVEAAE